MAVHPIFTGGRASADYENMLHALHQEQLLQRFKGFAAE
jgi:hypothetical protein